MTLYWINTMTVTPRKAYENNWGMNKNTGYIILGGDQFSEKFAGELKVKFLLKKILKEVNNLF